MLIFNDYQKYLKDYDFMDKANVTDFAECGIYFENEITTIEKVTERGIEHGE